MSPSVARALYRAIKRKQAHMASDVEHLLMPKYVSTICHQLSPKVQDLFIATSIAIAKARSPQVVRSCRGWRSCEKGGCCHPLSLP